MPSPLRTISCLYLMILAIFPTPRLIANEKQSPSADWRNIRTGSIIPDEGYSDQPYVVITKDSHWLCTFTTGPGREGNKGQHIVSTISVDRGKTWSPLVDIEPTDGPYASWAMPLVTPAGRVYVFYSYNGDRITSLGDKKNIRADTLGWYVYKTSDDNGRTWSKQRYRLPVRPTRCDRDNIWQGKVQMFWGIGKPITTRGEAFFGFSKIGKYPIDKTEGWFFHSDNILTESDPAKIRWNMLPEGDRGLLAPVGPIAEEHNLVALSDGALYTVYRTVDGYIAHAYSRDRGKTWTRPEYAWYGSNHEPIKNPRACPRLWKTTNGKYLLWYHNHSGKNYMGRNPAWIVGGTEVEGQIYWSQPEILLYDPDFGDRKNQNRRAVRISYPDLIEQNGRYWITETQKSVARVHEIDASLFEGLWDPYSTASSVKSVIDGLALELDVKTKIPGPIPMPRLPDLATGGGFSIELRVQLDKSEPGRVLFDTRDKTGKGIALITDRDDSIRIELNDGKTAAAWTSDPDVISPTPVSQTVVVTIDGGPKIITFVTDGRLNDGGKERQYGWGRFPKSLADVNARSRVIVPLAPAGAIHALRVYTRALRTAEAVYRYATSPAAHRL